MAALIPGHPTPIAPNAWRVLGRNPGMMTGPGTNSYLVGDRALTVIDPGPVDHEHTQALLHAAEKIGRPIEQILVTHTHRDHSPGARELAGLGGARARLTSGGVLGLGLLPDCCQLPTWDPLVPRPAARGPWGPAQL